MTETMTWESKEVLTVGWYEQSKVVKGVVL